MAVVQIQPLTPADREWVTTFTREHWGAETVAAHDTVYYPAILPGFYAVVAEARVGLLTYNLAAGACEIVTINSLQSGQGVGTALVEAVKQWAQQQGCQRLWLITTNDNLNALRFYQKRGFELVAVHRHAVTRARALKPQIPLLGEADIPLRDEIELAQQLS